jgi:hypothetical protein
MALAHNYKNVVTEIGKSQDGGKLLENDVYSKYLLNLIELNTFQDVEPNFKDLARVNMEDLQSNLKYSLHEFGKALDVVNRMIDGNIESLYSPLPSL